MGHSEDIEALQTELDALRQESQKWALEKKKLSRALDSAEKQIQRNRLAAAAKESINKVISLKRSELERYMNLLLENCPDMILLFDENAHIVYCTESFLRICRISAFGMIRGATCEELFSSYNTLDNTPGFEIMSSDIFRRVYQEKESVAFSGSVDFAKNGDTRSYNIQATPMLGEDGGTEGAVIIFTDITELVANVLIRNNLQKSIQKLEKEADKIYYDPLTGIYNRRYFDENIKKLIGSLSRSGSELSLMMVDIDFFKRYNDTYGHLEGDNCLRAVAETLRNGATRTDDFVARYGGEEFVIVLPNTDEAGARLIAHRLIDKIHERGIPHENSGAAKRVTFSIGVTTGIADHTLNAADYIRRADEMLYHSKQSGRDRYTFAALHDPVCGGV